MKVSISTFSTAVLMLAFLVCENQAASSCYSCNDCGTNWDISKASVVSTSGPNDYCRKTVTGPMVSKDYTSSCTSANLLGHGIFCCQTDLCNSANRPSATMLIFQLTTALLWIVYRYLF
ncbi:unnamed protein product [Adineta ricciae]|uniref:Uncharacterized protein n=1 Tax=Adineta ricciae TaxID=249248 RepID=A0A815MNR1_ADIRI|nr:unnamed protein product [Adineta ricciae]CAF1423117.1 unnamed protein product [Adineta ricciae]